MTTKSRWLAALLVTPRVVASSLCFAALSCGKAQPNELPALGEVVVSIDTDAPVPQLIGGCASTCSTKTGAGSIRASALARLRRIAGKDMTTGARLVYSRSPWFRFGTSGRCSPGAFRWPATQL